MLKAIIAGTIVMLSLPIAAANAQGERDYKWEAGFQVTTIQFGAPAEKPIGLGGRIGLFIQSVHRRSELARGAEHGGGRAG